MKTDIKRTLESVFACIAVTSLVSGLAAKPCFTKECVHTASYVLNNINPTVNPCDDFYHFACGKYIAEASIPDDKRWISVYVPLEDKLKQHLTDILTIERPKTDPIHYRITNDFYKACMNTSLIETLGLKPMQEIGEELGGWPVIVGDCWDSDNSWAWQIAAKNFSRLGFDIKYIVNIFIDVDLENNANRIIILDQPSLGWHREALILGFNESSVSDYYDYMFDTAVFFGADKERAKTELMESLIFEINLAHISWSVELRRNASALKNLYSIKQLQELYPYMQWLDFINSFLPAGLRVNEDEIINIAVASFFEKLGEVLNKTSTRAIANHMMWRMHQDAADQLPEKFRKRKLQFETGSTSADLGPRSNQCVDIVSKRLSAAVGYHYVKNHFTPESKDAAAELIKNIKEVFRKILENSTWMDITTKQNAEAKLDMIIDQVGYPDDLLNDTILENYYQSLNIDPDNFFKSFLMIKVFKQNYSFNQLRVPKSRSDWTTFDTPAEVDAQYSRTANSIKICAGILQGFLFNRERPQYMNYGTTGWTIGHEITHGFDDRGSLFDGYGNLKNWWQNHTRKTYLERTKCIIEQYDNYTDKVTGLRLNGVKTQGENIADNGGIKQSYLAYTEWLRKNGEELELPGLQNYTSRQMFWIAAAQSECAKHTKKKLESFVKYGVHSPSEFRILGPFSNSEEFSRDFKCDSGTRMNPTKKCEVW